MVELGVGRGSANLVRSEVHPLIEPFAHQRGQADAALTGQLQKRCFDRHTNGQTI